MPTVAPNSVLQDARATAASNPLSKKRRWDERRSDSTESGSGDKFGPQAIKIGAGGPLSPLNSLNSLAPSVVSIPFDGRPPSPRKMIAPSSKRMRLTNALDPAGAPDAPTPPPLHTSILMAPCHICQRKPRRKTDLESQADCEGCGRRACFVCLRECAGWSLNASGAYDFSEGRTPTEESSETPLPQYSTHHHDSAPKPWSATNQGHRRIICSRCCIERGEDGDVCCLGCMASGGQ